MTATREPGTPARAASKRDRRHHLGAAGAVTTAFALALWAATVFAQVQATYLYTLSSFAGRLRYDWVRVNVDQEREETYVIYQNLIRIFSPSGMEIFSFGDDLDLGQILDAAVEPNGDILLLSHKDGRSTVTRCNYRGVPIGPFEIRNLPDAMVFRANRMIRRNGLFYFASLNTSSVIITDANGEYREHVDFLALVDEDPKKKSDAEMFGFSVDDQGNIFFTIPVLFKVFKLSPDRKLASFGGPGSARGRFGVLGGVVSDSQGRVLVADKLKCVVMIFDQEFRFLTEFGYRGARPENLIVPDDIAVDKRNRVYVSQGRRRGVSVFALTP